MAYFDTQCFEALQKIGKELQKIHKIMEKEHGGGLNVYGLRDDSLYDV